jgi:transposase
VRIPFCDDEWIEVGATSSIEEGDEMVHFVGLDVSVKETSVCVVDDAGKVILEQKVPTEPADIIALLTSLGVSYGRIGIEAGPLSQWLVNALTAAELPVICVETRHMKALLTAQQINKTDRNDARGIAQMMRVGLFKPVHVKTLAAQEQRMLLTSRKLLQRKLLDLECDLRGTLRNFGLKVGVVGSSRYEARVRELVEGFPRLAVIAEPLLKVRRVMRQQLAVLHKMLLDAVRDDPVCRRLMTAPGVGAVVALTYRATVDQPQRFVHSRAVGAHVGLTPKRYQSGEIDYDGGVSKCGDALLRTMLYEAAQVLLTHGSKWSWLKAWGVRVAQRRGMRRAIVAVARRLAVVLHRMWVDGSEFRWGKDSAADCPALPLLTTFSNSLSFGLGIEHPQSPSNGRSRSRSRSRAWRVSSCIIPENSVDGRECRRVRGKRWASWTAR